MKLTLTANEAAKELCTSRNLIDVLRQEGAIRSIKKGNGFIYPAQDLQRFVTEWAGLDMSNRTAIRNSLRELERRHHDKS